MSDALYSTRLRWTLGKDGVAMLHAVRIQLPGHIQPVPALSDDLILIDYTPEVGVAMVQPRYDAPRDMTTSEIAACDRYLRILCAMEDGK